MSTRIKIYSWTVTSILFLMLAAEAITAQIAPNIREPTTPVTQQKELADAEEKLVRLAYKKLEIYSAVSAYRDGIAIGDITGKGRHLRFTLTEFRIGSISEISSELYVNIMGRAAGEVIQLSPKAVQQNDEEARVAYGVRWVPGQRAAIFDRNWTVGDILKMEASKYYDVTRFASYEVTVSFENKSRKYKALALVHGPIDNLNLEVWDSVTGMGGTVTTVLNEERLPFGVSRNSSEPSRDDHERDNLWMSAYLRNLNIDRVRSTNAFTCPTKTSSIQSCCLSEDLASYWETSRCDGWQDSIEMRRYYSQEDKNAAEDAENLADVQFYDQDDAGHISGTGVHHGRARFRPECSIISSTTQRCNVEIRDQGYGDTYENHSDWYYHVGTRAENNRGNDGPRGENIQCDSSVGFGFNYCAFDGCNVSVTLSVSGQGTGASATITGGNLWNSARAQGNTCNLSRWTTATPGGCNEPATYGCMSGFINVGGMCTRSTAFASQCMRFGEYDFDSCACSGGCADSLCSPIVVDVLGNGFDMTGASTGVFFDMDGGGNVDRFAWTAASSDDAWLALDRNNNGLIDNGKELFGNVTPQDIHADGVERNGFLALALYDSPAYGGNGDGLITQQDSIFSRLRLWKDENHNGVSESCELFGLRDLGLEKIDLNYRSSKRVDENGNEFRYRSKVGDGRQADIGRWAWDVFLVKQP